MHTHEIETTTDARVLGEVTAAVGWSASTDAEIVEVARCRLCGEIAWARWGGPAGTGTISGTNFTRSGAERDD